MKLKPSLITSYSTRGLARTFREMRGRNVKTAEVYCFSLQDMRDLTGNEGLNLDGSLSEAICQTLQDPGAVADRIDEWCGHELRICGMAMFTNHLADLDPRSTRSQADISAVNKVIELARCLQTHKRPHPCHTIELLAGARLQVPDQEAKIRRFVEAYKSDRWARAKLEARSEDEAPLIKKLLERLEPLGKNALKKNVRLAIEVEPGVTHVVCSPDAVDKLTRKMRGMSPNRLFWNADIGHLEIIDFEPEDFANVAEGLVVHGHLSNHASSHFADLPPTAFRAVERLGEPSPAWFTSTARFRQWLECFRDMEGPSGLDEVYVSIELEACQDADMAAGAYHWLAGVLQEIQEDRNRT